MNLVRQAAVAGTFYPADPHSLATQVNTLLEAVPEKTEALPKALIVPHAGYIYSGPIAASAYARLQRISNKITRVVLLGPSHRVQLNGLALPGVNAFATPLGDIPVDMEVSDKLQQLPQVQEMPAAHRLEHSLEVQLPFLQTVFGDFKLVPLVVGHATAEEVAEVLELAWGGEETLIVVSSDLSHYLPYEIAQETDRATADAIVDLHGPVNLHEACGGIPVNGLLKAAKYHGLQPRLLDLRNSGDTAGDKDRVVGYGAFGFYASH
ncbi:MAG: AmmeMemoRadiSam system protein B [Pseudomonadota bacterium]